MAYQTRPNFCDQCGNPIAPTHKFCSSCGKDISDLTIARPEVTRPEVTQSPSMYQIPNNPNIITPTTNFWNKLNLFGKVAVIAVGSIPLLIVFGMCMSSLSSIDMNNKGASNSENSSNPTPTPLYKSFDLHDIGRELDQIQATRSKNPTQGDLLQSKMEEKWIGIKIHTSGRVTHLGDFADIVEITSGDGKANCHMDETEWDDFINIQKGDSINVTGEIDDIDDGFFTRNILKLKDCQIGTEADRIQVLKITTKPNKNDLSNPILDGSYQHDGITFEYVNLLTLSEQLEGNITVFKSKWLGKPIVTTGTVHQPTGEYSVPIEESQWLTPISRQSSNAVTCGSIMGIFSDDPDASVSFTVNKTYSIIGIAKDAGSFPTRALKLDPCYVIYESP